MLKDAIGKKCNFKKKKLQSTRANLLTLLPWAQNWDDPIGRKVKKKIQRSIRNKSMLNDEIFF